MTGDDLEAVRARLAAREGECWARLEDAVSELWALHGLEEAEIVTRVRGLLERERREQEEAATE